VDLFLKQNGWLDTWHEFLQVHPEAGILGVGHPRFAGKNVFYDYRSSRPLKLGEAQFVNGTLMLIQPAVIAAVPLMDPFYCPGYWEDADYCFEAFWVARKDVWAYHVRCKHLGQAASKVNQYRLTPSIQTEKDLRRKQVANQRYFQHKWGSLLQPRRNSYAEELHFLQTEKLRRKGSVLPGPVLHRLNFLRKRMSMLGLIVG
jgi:GT2 family glycosyltransferase